MKEERTAAAGPRLWSTLGNVRYAALALVLLAAGTLVVGLTLPVMSIRRGVSDTRYSVVTGVLDLASGGNVLLALIVFAFSVVFPFAKLAMLLATLFARPSGAERTERLHLLALLGRWSMLDVFVVAILAGSLQLGILSDSEPRGGLHAFAAAILLSMLATVWVDRLAPRRGKPPSERVLAARPVRGRWTCLGAAALFVAGLALPLMTVEKWVFWDNEYSVLQGILELARGDQLPLAILLGSFVVALPAARFAALLAFHWRPPSKRVARVALVADKWAMFDVFGLALLIVVVKIGDIASVSPELGFWLLLGAVGRSIHDSWTLQRAASA